MTSNIPSAIKHLFWYDGQLVTSGSFTLDIDDPALIYGASIFTTMRIYDNDFNHPRTHWQAHMERLRHSLNVFNWEFSHWERLELGAKALMRFFPVLRMAIFSNGKEFIQGRNLPPDLDQNQAQGITGQVVSSFYDRSLANHKTGNYLGSWLALQYARKQGAREAILTDSADNWLETATGNLWGYDGQSWFTPPLASHHGHKILSGISRAHILEALQNDGFQVQEDTWSRDLVQNMSFIAYSNSVVEIIPFRRILMDEIQLEFAVDSSIAGQLRHYFAKLL